MLKRNLKYAPQTVKANAYSSLVRPKMEYAATVWDPPSKTSINKLERVQRRAARFVLNYYSHYSSVNQMLKTLNWPTLQVRRTVSKITLMYKIVNNLVAVPHSYLPPFLTTPSRTSHLLSFQRPYTRTTYYSQSFFPSTIVLWNRLPCHIVSSPTIDSFARNISSHLLSY